MKQSKTVFVGLSGGVDSSVAALRLKKQGYRVVGVFIKTWYPDFITCNIEAERLDAMRVAAALDIPFLTCDAEAAYKADVADYMIREYRAGRTPNPDVMCNQYVKFGAFLDYAQDRGADFIATGHYVQKASYDDMYALRRGADTNKDQSYFLWTLTQAELARSLFPVGDSTKEAIRAEAKRAGLPTYKKPDSQGICFLGQIDMKEFLSHYIDTQPGPVLDPEGDHIGEHDGALFYTIGQRHGFRITKTNAATKPHYVIGKRMDENELIVSTTPPQTEAGNIELDHINQMAKVWNGKKFAAQTRYRQTPFQISVEDMHNDCAILKVLEKTDAPSSGQSCVLYEDDRCVGGGIIV